MSDLASALADGLDRDLAAADAALATAYPGDPGTRQPVHTVYVPADRFDRGTASAWGAAGTESLTTFARAEDIAAIWALPDPVEGLDLRERVLAKLAAEPVEDLRIDFEDGYGPHSDDDEAADVLRAAGELRAAVDAGLAPPFTGIRVRSVEAPTRRRAIRTLVEFVAALGEIPDGFVVTLPKVTAVEQVSGFVRVLDAVEAELTLPAGVLRFEIQVETPQTVVGPDGTSPLPRMIAAAAGRCAGLHYGTYDYSASLGIAAPYQSMEHPAADHAKAVMQAAAAGTGVRLSDGSTNIIPIGSPDAVRAAWALHGRLVRRSLERGFYQGWDLHPAQLPSRYVAVYSFFRESSDAAAARLRTYLGRPSPESTGSGILDEPATATALAAYLLRGVDCKALSIDEVEQATGTDLPTLNRLARRPRG